MEISGEEWQRKMLLLKQLMDTETCSVHSKKVEKYHIGNGLDVHYDACCKNFEGILNDKIDAIQH